MSTSIHAIDAMRKQRQAQRQAQRRLVLAPTPEARSVALHLCPLNLGWLVCLAAPRPKSPTLQAAQ